jgi:hypothetical protein
MRDESQWLDHLTPACIIDVMEGVARPGEGQGSVRARAPRATGLLLACLLMLLAAPGALAATGSSTQAARRLCAEPPSLVAGCTAIRLLVPQQGVAAPASEPSPGAPGAHPASPEVEVTSPPEGFLTPQDLHAAYALPNESAASAKQTVAVIDAFDDPSAEADLAVYDEQFGLPACTSANGCFTKVNGEGRASPLPAEQGEWAGEISIDVQMVHAICQECHILLVEADNAELSELSAAAKTAIKLGAKEVSNSYASPEEPAIAGFFEELAGAYRHPGVVVTASSGDCGYLNGDCPAKPATANFPADLPDVIAVGGTTLTQSGETWTSTAWSEGGSGCSQIFAVPEWQRTVARFSATGCGTERSVADVAAVGDPKTGVDIFDSTPEGNGVPTGWTVFGGTSVSAPIVAAEYALAGGAQGATQPAATLYAHAGDSSDFFDVTSGANGSCASSTSCQAAVGFDGPTGLGSPLGLGAFAPAAAPTIGSVSPSSAITGETLKIDGSGLATVSGVDFGALPAKFEVISSSSVEATVPDGAVKAKVKVVTPGGEATSKTKFTPTLSITGFAPTHGGPGKTVTIKGVGFGAHSSVAFDGTAAQVLSATAKKLRVRVPAGAGAGQITVTNTSAPLGTVASADSFTP